MERTERHARVRGRIWQFFRVRYLFSPCKSKDSQGVASGIWDNQFWPAVPNKVLQDEAILHGMRIWQLL